MADTLTTSVELNVQLLSEDGNASRIIKIANPDTEMLPAEGGRGVVERTLSPILGYAASDAATASSYFFYDDASTYYDTPMTRFGTIEIVAITKSVRSL